MNLELQKQVTPFLRFLEDRFRAKIQFDRYVLSYSGGKDSHFLYWFIREWFKKHYKTDHAALIYDWENKK